MKIQKRHWFIIFSVIAFVVGMEVLQYGRTLREDIVAAVQTIPNPGHSWAEMESGPDSIQVSGRTITNLTAPINSTDATNKEYVDAASGSSYGTCYLVNSTSSGVSCSTGYTTLVSVDSVGRFAFDSSLSSVIFSPVSTFFVGVGGGLMEVKTSYTGTDYVYPIYWYHWQGDWLSNNGTGVAVTTCSDASVAGKTNLTLNGTTYTSIVACNNGNNGIVYMPVSLALCCK